MKYRPISLSGVETQFAYVEVGIWALRTDPGVCVVHDVRRSRYLVRMHGVTVTDAPKLRDAQIAALARVKAGVAGEELPDAADGS
jgi:hypothetical protein